MATHVNTSTQYHPDPPKHCSEKCWLVGDLNSGVLAPQFPPAELGLCPGLQRGWEWDKEAPVLEGHCHGCAIRAPQPRRGDEEGEEISWLPWQWQHGAMAGEQEIFAASLFVWFVTKKIRENS